MLMRPAARADVAPQLRLVLVNYAYSNIPRKRFAGTLYPAIHHVADLKRPISPRTQQVQCPRSRKRAHLVHRLRPAIEKEPLDLIQGCGGEILIKPKPKGLRRWRVNTVKHNRRARASHPR